MKKSRVWEAIVPGTQTKPQDTLQIRKTPWRGVTKQPPAVPLPGPNVTPEPNEKIKGLAGNYSRHTKQATRHPSNQENTLARRDETASCPEPNEKIKGLAGNCSRHTKQATRHPSNQWHGVTKQPPAVPLRGQTSLLNRMKKSRVWQALVPGTQNKPQDTLQIRKTPWHGVTKQPPAVPLPGPNVTPEPNEKIKGLAGNCKAPVPYIEVYCISLGSTGYTSWTTLNWSILVHRCDESAEVGSRHTAPPGTTAPPGFPIGQASHIP